MRSFLCIVVAATLAARASPAPDEVQELLCVDLADSAFVTRCRAQLEHDGYVHICNFLTDAALSAMLREERCMFEAGQAFRSSEDHTVSLSADGDDGDSGSGAGAVDRSSPPLQRSSKWLIAFDQLAQESALRRLYQSDALRAFVSAVVGAPLFPSADPMNALHTNRYCAGDGLGWHFDNSEFFVNLVLAQVPSRHARRSSL
jgi:hypothetical protein